MAARNPPPYATIIFVFLWVMATGVAIWLAVEKGKMEEKIVAADAKVANAIKASTAAEATQSRLKAMMVQESGKSADEVINEVSRALQETGHGSSTLVPALRDMASRVKQSDELAKQTQDQNADLQRQIAAANKEKDAAGIASNAALNREKALADTARAEVAKVRAEHEVQLAAAQAAFTKAQGEWDLLHRELVLKNEELRQEVATRDNIIVQKNDQIVGMRPKVGTTLAGLESAGIVVRAKPGASECYINLGKKDRITLGLTFSVHDPRVGVKLATETDLNKISTDPDIGGKASIEVIKVNENESLCRINYTRRGQLVEPGDLIANLFFQQNKDRKFRFVVFGDFDLDGDGVATSAERDRLVRLIGTWGGIVEDKITSETDYLVLGSRPAAPDTKDASAEPGGVIDQQIQNQTIFDELFVEAKRSSVPILNANRFLTFIGFYNNTVAQ